MRPPEHVPFSEGPAPEKGTLRICGELRGASPRRTRRQTGADCGTPPEEHPLDERAEFRVPVIYI